MNLANVAVSPGTQGLVVALVALQQANGIDLETALGRGAGHGRVRVTARGQHRLDRARADDPLVRHPAATTTVATTTAGGLTG